MSLILFHFCVDTYFCSPVFWQISNVFRIHTSQSFRISSVRSAIAAVVVISLPVTSRWSKYLVDNKANIVICKTGNITMRDWSRERWTTNLNPCHPAWWWWWWRPGPWCPWRRAMNWLASASRPMISPVSLLFLLLPPARVTPVSGRGPPARPAGDVTQ